MTRMGEINWYEENLVLAIDGATDDLLTRLPFIVEGEYKVRARVDTGFMRNSAYAITPGGNHRAQAEIEALSAADRPLAPEPPVKVNEHEAAVHVAAEYTIYNEMKDHALYQAVQKAKQIAPSEIKAVGRERFGR